MVTTVNYSFELPTVQGDFGSWGDKLNANWESLDTILNEWNENEVVGTVSQSGGTPTGKVIERGSNANGSYTRLADGTQICWIDNAQIVASAASVADYLWTFPIAFSANPNVQCTLPYYSASWSVTGERHNVSGAVAAPVDETKARIGYYPVTTPITVTVSDVQAVAIGRWF